VPEHVLDGANGNLLRFPIAGASLAESVQIVMLANRMRLAGRLNLSGRVVPARCPRCRTVPAIHARSECDALELAKEVIVGATEAAKLEYVPGEYFIFSLASGRRLDVKRDDKGVTTETRK
jgi:hypothetical protein